MPLRYLNRSNSSTTISAGNSVLFNGSNQYLSLPASSNWAMTGNFTVECWVNTNLPSGGSGTILSLGSNSSAYAGLRFQINRASSGATPVLIEVLISTSGGSWGLTGQTSALMVAGIWNHVAVVRSSGVVTVYINGVGYNIGTINGTLYAGPYNAIGKLDGYSDPRYYNGYISNLRILNGTALYTASFTAPTAPLTAIANTSLLTCKSATIVDASSNNFTITNNGAATVSSTVPFTASFAPAPSGMKFGNRNNSVTATQTGKSVQFNGSNQYLSVGSVANWAFLNNGSTPFTIEAWINPTSVSTSTDGMIVSTTGYQAQIGFYFQFGNYNNGDVVFAICDGRSKINQWAISNNFLTANTWTHVAVSFTPNGTNVPSATVKFFVNGILATSSNVVTNTTTYSTSNPTNTLLVGAYQTPFGGYFPGKMSNLRILNGTALYTASFTAPTAPLTAIANTSLLTCNAATIVDGSSNNFTITNNNSATVSSITPFTVASAASTTRVRKVYADAVSSIITSGLVLNLDASNASSYPGSGTSWFDLSGNGNTGTLVNGVGYNSANGGSLVFDGVDDFVRITLPSTTSYNTFTYNSWIYSTSDSGYRTIIDQDNDDWALFSFNGQLISYDPNFSSGYTLNLNQWYNVVMSHADGGPVLFYVNGSLVYTSSNTSINHTTSYFGIGAGIINPTTADECWSGRIAQASIYNRALSASEVLQNYNITKAKFGL